MPANLTPDYYRAEEEYRAAKTADEKIACLQRMLSISPNTRVRINSRPITKRRIAQLKTTEQNPKRKDLHR
jgi:hypothetical protein